MTVVKKKQAPSFRVEIPEKVKIAISVHCNRKGINLTSWFLSMTEEIVAEYEKAFPEIKQEKKNG